MRIGKRTAEFLVNKKILKNFDLFNLSVLRADGKLESFTLSRKAFNEGFDMRGEIVYPVSEYKKYETVIDENRVKDILKSALDLGREFKRISISQAEKIVFMDLWEK